MNCPTNSLPYGYGGRTADTSVLPVRIIMLPTSSSRPLTGAYPRSATALIKALWPPGSSPAAGPDEAYGPTGANDKWEPSRLSARTRRSSTPDQRDGGLAGQRPTAAVENRLSRPRQLVCSAAVTWRRVGFICGVLALLLSACGGGARQDASEPNGNFPVLVTTASFPASQRLSGHSHFVLAIRNTGSKTIPNIAVTICNVTCAYPAPAGEGTSAGAFAQDLQMQGLANASRPVWVVDRPPGACNYGCKANSPGGEGGPGGAGAPRGGLGSGRRPEREGQGRPEQRLGASRHVHGQHLDRAGADVREQQRADRHDAREQPLGGRLLLARGGRLLLARGGPEGDAAVNRDLVDLLELARVEVQAIERRHVLLELGHRARAEQRRGDPRVAEHPGDRHLGQRLPAPLRDFIELPHAGEVLVADHLLGHVVAPAQPRVLGHAVQVAVGQQALGERREHDRADALAVEHVEQLGLDPPVEQRVGRLMDEQRRAQLAQDQRRLLGPARTVGGDSHVARLALADGGVERPHRLLERRLGIEPVRVEDVDVVESHPLEALLEAGQEILARAPPPARTRPHVVAGLGRDDDLVAVGLQVLAEDPPEIDLGTAVRRAVVVGQVEVGDAEIERTADHRPAIRERPVVAEVLPESERDRRQLEAAAPAAPVGHPVVARLIGHVGLPREVSVERHHPSIPRPPLSTCCGQFGHPDNDGPDSAR